jgi:tetratricopeptide (TPR) repeat protein
VSRNANLTISLLLSAAILVSCRQTAQQYVTRGNAFANSAKYDDAIINYKKAIQRNSNFGEAYYRMALADLKLGKGSDAYNALNTATRLLPDRTDVEGTLGELLLVGYFGNKNRPAALYNQLTKLADQLVAKDPNSYDGLRFKGALAWTDGKLKEAEDHFQRANSRNPLQPELILMWMEVLFRDGQAAQGEHLAQELIRTHQDAASIYDALYAHYRSENRLADAENILKAKVNNNPHEIRYAMQLAMFYATQSRRDQMIATLERVLNDQKTFPGAHLAVGDFYASLHEWPEALREYEAGAKSNPNDKITYLKRVSDAWLAQGKADQASGVVAEILKQRPKDESALAVNASLLVKTRQPEKVQEAIKDFEDLVNKEPNNPLIEFSLGQALLVKGDQNGAMTHLRESLKKRPNYIPSMVALAQMSLSKNDYNQALRYTKSALALNPRLVEARLVRTAALLGTHDYLQARNELTTLENELPANLDVQFQLAFIDLAEKKYPQVEARLERIYPQDPHRALARLVDVYRDEGKPERALSRLRLELEKTPADTLIRSLLAETALRASKYDVALAQYQQLQSLLPPSPQLFYRLGTAYQLKGNFPQAISSFEQAKALAPRDPQVSAALGDALHLAGREEDAEANYRQTLALDPENTNAMNNLAYTLLSIGGPPDEAQKLAEKALQKAPHNPNYADTLGMVYLKKNLGESALRVYVGLIQRYPDNPVFRYHYALTLTQKGEKKQARTELEAALHERPSDQLRKSIESSLAGIKQ